ncbi:MAG: signal peptide peptidase SppA [Thermoplasmataceae archaeon]
MKQEPPILKGERMSVGISMFILRLNFSQTISRRSIDPYLPILEMAARNRKIVGVIVVVNSSGGESNASEILANSFRRVSEKKPLYAVIEAVGASGAYWFASTARKIYAMDTSLVGSIGIISISPNVRQFLDKLGIRVELNKIGKYKDMMSPFSDTDEDSRNVFRSFMADVFERFKTDVIRNRSIPPDMVDEVINGKIFSSKEALNAKLIDRIGDYQTAIDDMKKELNFRGKVKTIGPKRTLIGRIIGSNMVGNLIKNEIESFIEDNFQEEMPQLLFRV